MRAPPEAQAASPSARHGRHYSSRLSERVIFRNERRRGRRRARRAGACGDRPRPSVCSLAEPETRPARERLLLGARRAPAPRAPARPAGACSWGDPPGKAGRPTACRPPLSHGNRRRASPAQPPHDSRRRASSARPLSRPLPEHVPERSLASTRIPLEGDRGGSRAFFSRFWTLASKFRGVGRSRAVGPSVFPGHENSHSDCAGILPPQAPADLGISAQVSIFRRFPCTQAAPTTRPAPRRVAAGAIAAPLPPGGRRRAAAGGPSPQPPGGQSLLLRQPVGTCLLA